MDEKTLKALRGSIRKWEGIVAGTKQDLGVNNCPLCRIFVGKEDDCGGCPVREKTGKQHCRDTPYADFNLSNGDIIHAKRELDFLRSLLPDEAAITEE